MSPEQREVLLAPDARAGILFELVAIESGHDTQSRMPRLRCLCGLVIEDTAAWSTHAMLAHLWLIGAEQLEASGLLPPRSARLAIAYLSERPRLTNVELAVLLDGLLTEPA